MSTPFSLSMTVISNTEQLRGLRAPSGEEHERLTLSFQYQYKTLSRTCNRFSSGFAVLGALLMGSYSSGGVFAVLFGLLCFCIVFALILSKKKEKMILERISAGTFQVLEGTVQEYRNDIRTPYSYSVRFLSQYDQLLEEWHHIRYEGVADDSPLLLVYVRNSPIRRVNTWLFTPYMLSDEGLQKHW